MKKKTMMKGLASLALCFVASVLCLPACSVKENRVECPCYVSVKTDIDETCVVSFYDEGGALIERKDMTAEELRSGKNWTAIPKGPFFTSVLSGKGSMVLSGGRLVECPRGGEASPIYSWAKGMVAEGDELVVDGVLQKQHAVVTLRFANPGAEEYPYDIRISFGCNALDLLSLKGSEGFWQLDPVLDGALECSFLVTRQDPGRSITLEFFDRESGEAVGTLDLGRYILATGYSWDTEWLGDVNVLIDYAKSSVTIYINDWTEGATFVFKI